MGDGDVCDTYPEVMARTMGMQLRAILLDTKSTEAGWPAKADFEWNDPQTMIARMRNPAERGIGTVVLWDYKYVDEYYKPVRRESLRVRLVLMVIPVLRAQLGRVRGAATGDTRQTRERNDAGAGS
jgi:hypothetical protein